MASLFQCCNMLLVNPLGNGQLSCSKGSNFKFPRYCLPSKIYHIPYSQYKTFEVKNFCGFCLNHKCFPVNFTKCFGTCGLCFDTNVKVFPQTLTQLPNCKSFVPCKFFNIITLYSRKFWWGKTLADLEAFTNILPSQIPDSVH